MPFFGQVWVWSLAGFLVGALLCWVLIANPARKRVAELQTRLNAARRREAANVAERPKPAAYDQFGARNDFDEFHEELDGRDDFADELLSGGDDRDDFAARRDADDFRPQQSHGDDFDRTDFEHTAFDSAGLDSTGFDSATFDRAEFDQAEFAAEHARLDDPVHEQHDHDQYADHGEPAGDQTMIAGPFEDRHFGAEPPHAESTQFIPAARAAELAEEPVKNWFAGNGEPAEPEHVEELDTHLVDDLDEVGEDEPVAEFDHAEYEDDADSGTIFTQHTTPIPAELIRQIDAQGDYESTAGALVDDLDDLDDLDEVHGFQQGRLDEDPAPATQFFQPVPEPEPAPEPEPEPEPARPAYVSESTQLFGQLPEGVAPVPLPKRIPAKPQQGRIPFGVQSSPPAAPAAAAPVATVVEPEPVEATTTLSSDRERSLFEPVRSADESPTRSIPQGQPRQQRSRAAVKTSTGVDPFVPPGPFGPGSAMPLPGGTAPSSEYTIKASVTALRYCSPESPKFHRTIAEVWFRSVADAERVGFRPLG